MTNTTISSDKQAAGACMTTACKRVSAVEIISFALKITLKITHKITLKINFKSPELSMAGQ